MEDWRILVLCPRRGGVEKSKSSCMTSTQSLHNWPADRSFCGPVVQGLCGRVYGGRFFSSWKMRMVVVMCRRGSSALGYSIRRLCARMCETRNVDVNKRICSCSIFTECRRSPDGKNLIVEQENGLIGVLPLLCEGAQSARFLVAHRTTFCGPRQQRPTTDPVLHGAQSTAT